MDGIEIVSSMGYLPSQFLNPRLNLRDDEFGGSAEGRLKFLKEIIIGLRRRAGSETALGIRLSIDEMDGTGLRPEEAIGVVKHLAEEKLLDYINVIAATTASYDGWLNTIPHMAYPPAYLSPLSRQVKEAVDLPVMIAGRITQPQEAERVLAEGDADMVGLVRAHICDPQFTRKAKQGRPDDIRACIGCNQACIGHGLKGHSISCIQFPETGRELRYLHKPRVEQAKRVLVVGAGPGGMKAASVAAERGHEVTVWERSSSAGGQVALAQLLPGRAEFGGVTTNLLREMDRYGVDLCFNTEATADAIQALSPDAIIIATGASSQLPPLQAIESGAPVVDSWSVIREEAEVGASVVIWDWRCDWVGLGLAQMLAQNGSHVRLAVNGIVAGQNIPSMVRDHAIGELHKLGVEIVPYLRLYGADEDSVYFQHVTSGEPVVFDNVDTFGLTPCAEAQWRSP